MINRGNMGATTSHTPCRQCVQCLCWLRQNSKEPSCDVQGLELGDHEPQEPLYSFFDQEHPS